MAGSTQFVCQRRYNDFVWFRNQLIGEFQGVIVPPLPEKSIIGKFSADFIDNRKRGLDKFLNRVLTHEDLCKVYFLKNFYNQSRVKV